VALFADAGDWRQLREAALAIAAVRRLALRVRVRCARGLKSIREHKHRRELLPTAIYILRPRLPSQCGDSARATDLQRSQLERDHGSIQRAGTLVFPRMSLLSKV
jgi:hypothetical protein